MIECIISGGQTGADQAGLEAAIKLGIVTSGFAPKGYKTEAGACPWLGEKYGLIQLDSSDYTERTECNVKMAHATVIFGRRSAGSNLTEELCRKLGKPCAWVLWIPQESVSFPPTVLPNNTFIIPRDKPLVLRSWITRNQYKILNIAGNRESKNPGVGEFTQRFLTRALAAL